MKCPHCEYEVGWSPEKQKMVDPDIDIGLFYTLCTRLEREDQLIGRVVTQHVHLVGCPKCFKTFISE
jgi:hypothetical protein